MRVAMGFHSINSDLPRMRSFAVELTHRDHPRRVTRVRGYVSGPRTLNGAEPPRVPGPRRPVDATSSVFFHGSQAGPHSPMAGS